MATQARRKGTYRLRAASALVALAVMLWLLVISSANLPSSEQGRSIFVVLSTISFIFCLFVGARATSDCLSEEKREGTLGLLFLTDLRGIDVVLGKVTANSLLALFALLGVVPVLSLAILLGGVSYAQVALCGAMFLNTMFLSLAAGAFVSALSRNERRAMVGCGVLVLVVALGPFAVALATTGAQTPYVPEIVWPSPIYTFVALQQSPLSIGGVKSIAGVNALAAGFAMQHVLAWMLLFAAGFLLRRSINEVPPRTFERLRSFADNHVYGGVRGRREHRSRLLDKNAFLWLAAREKIKPRYAWLILGFCFGGWLLTYLGFPDMAFDLPVLTIFLFLAHFVFKLWVASEVCSRLIEDRRSGALELLLSTPLSVREIARGQSMALRHIFFGPVCALLLSEIVLLGLVRQASPQEVYYTFGAGMSIFLLDLWALKWVGMWQSLFGKSIERVLFTTILRVLAVPWLFFFLAMTVVAASSPFTGVNLESAQVVTIWWVISGVVGLVLGLTARAGFFSYFRSAAAQQFEVARKAPGSVTRWAGELSDKFPSSARLARRLPAPVREHWILSSISAVLLLVLLGTLVRQFYWHTQLQSELALIRKANLPITPLDIAQFNPPVPPHENAIEALRKPGPPQLRGFQYSASSSGIFETQLAANRGQLAAFRSLTNFSKAYIEPSESGPIVFFAFFPSHNYAQLGWMEMTVAADAGDVPRALGAAESFIALAKALRQNPSPDLQVMCAQQLTEFGRSLENLLRKDLLEAEALASLQVKIAAIDNPQALERTLAYARWRAIAATHQNWGRFRPARGERILFAVVTGFLNSTGSTDKFLTEYLRAMDRSLALTRLPLHESIDAAREIEKGLNFRVSRIGFPMAQHNTFYIDASFELEASLRTRLAILETAVAIERYRRRNRKLPENLAELVPGFLAAVPIDASSGDPLFYQNQMLSTLSMDRRIKPPWRSRAPSADMMFRFDRR